MSRNAFVYAYFYFYYATRDTGRGDRRMRTG